MKTVIVFKWAKNPEDARVGSDGAVDWRVAKMAVSDDDAAAVTVARELSAGGDLVGLTLGDGDVAWAAARGASSTVCVTDAHPNPDAAVTAAILAAGVRHVDEVDVVVIGDCLWDHAVPVTVGANLGWCSVAGVVSATIEGDSLRVTRKTSAGTQVLRVQPPAVLAVAARHTEDKVPGMKDVLLARKKPVEKVSITDLQVVGMDRVTVRGTALPQAAPARIFDGSDPATAVKQLVSALRAEGVL